MITWLALVAALKGGGRRRVRRVYYGPCPLTSVGEDRYWRRRGELGAGRGEPDRSPEVVR